MLLIYIVLFLFPCALKAEEQSPRDLFAGAYAFFAAEDFSRAEPLFLKTLQTDYVLADYSLYFLGRISVAAAKNDAARAYFTELKQRFPKSIWLPRADLELARILVAEKHYDTAIQQLRSVLKSGSDVAAEALFVTGQIHEARGDPGQAYSAFQELRRTGPLSPWAARARAEVARLRARDPETFSLASHESLWNEAELLSTEREYGAAEKVYRSLLDTVSDETLRPRLLTGLSNVLRAQRKREEEVPILNVVVSRYMRSSFAPAALFRLATLYWNRDDNLKALDHFDRLQKQFPASSLSDAALLAIGRIHESLNKNEEAIGVYDRFAAAFPKSPLREEAQWRLGWIYYAQSAYHQAYAAFAKLSAEDGGADRYKIGGLYWRARTAERIDQVEDAKKVYAQIIRSYEDSYYVGLAAKRLKALGGDWDEPREPARDTETTPSFAADVAFHFARARELTQISIKNLALRELDDIKDRGAAGNAPLILALCREYARNGAYARSVALANQIPLSSAEVKIHRYPLAYWELIKKKAAERGLDPYLIVALIRQESLFDPNAVSTASALGLMQLLPSTAKRIAQKLRLSEPAPEHLFDADLNLSLGIYHLKELLDRYGNNHVKALAAYNAGEKAVAQWERQIATNDDEEFTERLTYRETLGYVKLVLRNYRNYKLLYGNRVEQIPPP